MPTKRTRPLVSCIVPLHNGAQFIAEALRSVCEQDYPALETIVVDDGSTDDGPAIAASFRGVRVVAQRNSGNATARNRGIDEARGDYLTFLDQDDVWLPGKVGTQLDFMLDRPELLFCYGLTEFFLQQRPSPAWFQDKLLQGSHAGFGPGVLMARRTAFEQVGRFDEGLSTTSDVEWFVKATEMAVPSARVPKVMLRKRVHASAQSSKAQVYHPELLGLLRRSIARRRGSA